jgi:hypothetical protein
MTGMTRFRYPAWFTQTIGYIGLHPTSRHLEGSVPRTLVAVDVIGFGNPCRDDEAQFLVRQSLYGILQKCFRTSGISWRRSHCEDRGDGVLIVLPHHVPTSVLFDVLVVQLRAGLKKHNQMASDAARIELRMAIHLGHVRFDDWGVSGHSVVQLFRFLEAPDFKQRLAASGAEFGLIISDDLYRELNRQRAGLVEPAAYQRLTVSLKETHAVARAYLPSTAAGPLAASTEDEAFMRLA